MPRRKPKHLYGPGQSGNPNGRPIGSTNQINNEIRDAFAMLLQSQIPNLQDWLDRAAKKDPIKALDIFTKISERFIPALSRTEITSADGQAFTPITINLPNIPQLNMSIGGGAPEKSLPASPGEEPKELPEPNPTFLIPKFDLSPNILRDIQETGEDLGDFNTSLTPGLTGSPTP